jgi:hypothetical protein
MSDEFEKYVPDVRSVVKRADRAVTDAHRRRDDPADSPATPAKRVEHEPAPYTLPAIRRRLVEMSDRKKMVLAALAVLVPVAVTVVAMSWKGREGSGIVVVVPASAGPRAGGVSTAALPASASATVQAPPSASAEPTMDASAPPSASNAPSAATSVTSSATPGESAPSAPATATALPKGKLPKAAPSSASTTTEPASRSSSTTPPVQPTVKRPYFDPED